MTLSLVKDKTSISDKETSLFNSTFIECYENKIQNFTLSDHETFVYVMEHMDKLWDKKSTAKLC